MARQIRCQRCAGCTFGLQGNNNTDPARAMRAWIAFRDEEELAKREKEGDMKALDVRRERSHELETKQLRLIDVCRYETMIMEEEEEIGLQGVETSDHTLANGDRSHQISLG